MALESIGSLVHLRPRAGTLQTSQGRTVLDAGLEGFISKDDPRQGLWVYETRMLSDYRWLIDGKQPQMSACSNIEQHSWMGYYIQAPANCKDTPTRECNPLQETVELRLSRFIGDGMHEDVDLTNHTQIKTSFHLKLETDCDFGDRSGSKRGENGQLLRKWHQAGEGIWELEYTYQAEHSYCHQDVQGQAKVARGISVRIEHADSEPTFQGNSILFKVELQPHASWRACLTWTPAVDEHPLTAQYGCDAFHGATASDWDRNRNAFLSESTQFKDPSGGSLTPLVIDVLNRSKRDLAWLRLHDMDQNRDSWIPAAGLPTYVALFGRDTLTAGWESPLLGTELMRGSLSALPRFQATGLVDWRDEQPGRLVHGRHSDPTSMLNYNPHRLYYGGVTASIFYPLVVADLWHWTGDEELVRPFIEPAMKALAWADAYSRDEDGFYKYRTRSEQGEKNQGWKDSGDAIVHADGSQAEDPIGTCEMQAFVFASKLRFSQLLYSRGQKEIANKLYRESQELKKRFNDVFWMDQEGYIGMGIDSKKRLIRSVGSDPGQCLIHGIVDGAFIPRLTHRMMAGDMFSGWGIRTLSSEHPAYNPFAYHRGTVWPVMNAMFSLGLARYGLHIETQTLCKAIFESASLFTHKRLPEVFAGHQRDDKHPFPGMYVKADWPQAWSASAPFAMIQALLGIVPYAPMNMLFLDPALPAWLPGLRLEGLRVGQSTLTLAFHREADGITSYEVFDQQGPLQIVRQSGPWSTFTGSGQHVEDILKSFSPV